LKKLFCDRLLWWLLFVAVVTATLCLPFIRYVGRLGDEGILLHGAERMLRGDKLYVDFFEILPPGGFLITKAWLDIMGLSILSARLLVILVVAGIACLLAMACWQASKSAVLSVLLALGWVMMSQGAWTQVSHHWFTTLLAMAVISLTLATVRHAGRWLRGPFLAGVMAGAAVMITSTRGALAMLAAALAFATARRFRSQLAVMLFGAALVPILLVVYLAWHGSLMAAVDDIIIFPATRYADIQWVPWGTGAHRGNRPLAFLFPLTLFGMVLTCVVAGWRTCWQDPKFLSCTLFGVAGFVGCFPRPHIVNIGFAAPLVCPLLAYCAAHLLRPVSRKHRCIVIVVAIVLCVPSAAGYVQTVFLVHRGQIVPTPRGSIVMNPGAESNLVAKIAAMPSSETYFFYPYIPLLAFMTGHEHVSKYDIFIPWYTTPDQYQEACISVTLGATWLVIDQAWTEIKHIRLSFPKMPDSDPPEKKAFEHALDTGFELVWREGRYELRHRTPTANATLCDGITRSTVP
jgi:hypothetical protein